MTPFFDAIREQSLARAGHTLLLASGRSPITHGEALSSSAQFANALRRRGLRSGDRLAVMTEKSPDAVLLYLACLQSGIVYVPINPGFRTEEAAHIAADADPSLLVCVAGREDWSAALKPGLCAVSLETLAAEASSEPSTHADVEADLAVILHTSGTTGRPKGAMLTQTNILANARSLSRWWRFTPDDVLLHVVPLFHSHGLFVSLSCTLLSGSAVHLLSRFDSADIIALLPRCTVFMGVPTMYSRLLSHSGLTPEACRAIRLFACGSAPLSPADFATFAARTGHEMVERYGMSETAINCSNPIDGPRRPGTVGAPIPGVELRIAGAEASGVVGAVQVRGPHVFTGYWRRPEQTAAAFTPDGWFDTGDLGRLDPDGTLTLVGRSKDLIISGGYNVYPIEVEHVLEGLEGVAQAAVIGLPHPDYGEAVTAMLVPSEGATLDEPAIIAAVKTRLAAYKAPKRVLVLPNLPRNDIGKVQKTVLQQMHATLYQPGIVLA